MSDTATFSARNAALAMPILDGRTRTAKRLQALATGFAAAIGGNLSPIQEMLVQRAARNVLLLEIDQARALAGDRTVTEEMLTRRDNTARRSIVDLNLPGASVQQTDNVDDLLSSIVGGDA